MGNVYAVLVADMSLSVSKVKVHGSGIENCFAACDGGVL